MRWVRTGMNHHRHNSSDYNKDFVDDYRDHQVTAGLARPHQGEAGVGSVALNKVTSRQV
jgi:hypothetical protein